MFIKGSEESWIDAVDEYLLPVELPSEEEICDEAYEKNQDINPETKQYIWKYAFDDDQSEAFITGAKWMRDKFKDK